jgi:succinyl-diaminopimelate desuccinylase
MSGSLDLTSDPAELTVALCDIASPSGQEAELADQLEQALRTVEHLQVVRVGDNLVARTSSGRSQRVLLAGHLDTVPVADNLPVRRVRDGSRELLIGCGSADMKSGLAVMAHLAGTLPPPGAVVDAPMHDLTFVFYAGEEVEADRNGLGQLARSTPELLAADLAVLLEPTNAAIEAGCQGTVRVEVVVTGQRAHTARSWLGRNAIHAAADVLDRLRDYRPREVQVDGLTYREGLQAVGVQGGVAGNVVPDRCLVTVNYRFAPDRSMSEAVAHLREVFTGYDVLVRDAAPAAPPALVGPLASGLVAAVGGPVRAKLGWTDVARFAQLGVPALNYGPGDPTVAHTVDEYVDAAVVRVCTQTLRSWLTGAG